MKILMFLFVFYTVGPVIKAQNYSTDIKKLISKKMNEQENSWNNGNLEGFMEHYWKSDSLIFIGKNGVKNGWLTTLNNYKKSYPDKDEMGQLTFTNISIKKIDKITIHVIGKWELSRKKELGDLKGYYSLIWQLRNNKWVIITDHSS